MTDDDLLAQRFEADRRHLRSVAYRMLGSAAEADDAVQEAWIRLSRSDTDAVENLTGWLTTVVARVCLDMLRSRTARREEVLDHAAPVDASAMDPEEEALLADSVGPALLVVLETLTPAERLAFVLHDTFAVPFDEIARILGRSPEATRQLASRARRRVQGADAPRDRDPIRQREIVEAFLVASRDGDFDALVALLHPDAVLRTDAAAESIGAMGERGALAVAGRFSGSARAARPALIDGEPGLVWLRGGELQVVFTFEMDDERVTEINLLADRERLEQFDIVMLDR